ncbi:M1 family metallopeptidase [Saccharomonospora iraqiensis]|uniref:M1 family metallopeptidase n=1 Tax=Saccharomonospora iraqiensis TaxID=52698 RepID=UPI0004033A6E|nr:M1 family metallopeptidase [Saccharomonospora iraqiensis]
MVSQAFRGGRHPRTAGAVALCGLVSVLVSCTAPAPDSGDGDTTGADAPAGAAHGAPGIGDDYYPTAGNGGYDARHYAVTVRYDPEQGHLDGDTTVTARATRALDRFNLDLRGFEVSSVEVDGEPAEHRRADEGELVVTPAQRLGDGDTFEARVRYAGEPVRGDSEDSLGEGWSGTPSGGAFVLGEPRSASYWYPVNEHPRDKATFELTARVPEDWTVVSIGRKEGERTDDGWTTTTWNEPDPVASYLTVFAVDRFTVERGELPDGTPVRNAFAPGTEDAREVAGRVDDVVAFLEERFGDYPASTAGGIYLNENTGFALETQGTPTYPPEPDVDLVVHEMAHQWYGNSVSLHSWADICLNECFASYATWLWAEHRRGADLDAHYAEQIERLRGNDDFWSRPLYDMGAGNEFGAVYGKGPLAVHALRRQVGDTAFDRMLREWPAEHADGNARWPQFEEFAERISGKDLRGFFDAWFRGAQQPADEYL